MLATHSKRLHDVVDNSPSNLTHHLATQSRSFFMPLAQRCACLFSWPPPLRKDWQMAAVGDASSCAVVHTHAHANVLTLDHPQILAYIYLLRARIYSYLYTNYTMSPSCNQHFLHTEPPHHTQAGSLTFGLKSCYGSTRRRLLNLHTLHSCEHVRLAGMR